MAAALHASCLPSPAGLRGTSATSTQPDTPGLDRASGTFCCPTPAPNGKTQWGLLHQQKEAPRKSQEYLNTVTFGREVYVTREIKY